jgi:hypothetical protein
MTDPKRNVTNPEFKAAVAKFKKENTPQNFNAMAEKLMGARLLAPIQIDFAGKPPLPDAFGKMHLNPSTKISFAVVNTSDERQYMLAFTDWQELQKWKKDPNQQLLILKFDDYANMLAKDSKLTGFVVNAYGANIRFESNIVKALREQRDKIQKAQNTQQPLQPDDKVVFVEPSVFPEELADLVCETLRGKEEIEAAYLEIMIVNETRQSYILVLDVPQAQEPAQKLFQELGNTVKPYLAKHPEKTVHIAMSTSVLGQQAAKGSEPFYTKEKGRIRDED